MVSVKFGCVFACVTDGKGVLIIDILYNFAYPVFVFVGEGR